MYRLLILFFLLSFTNVNKQYKPGAWIRINQLGYTNHGTKVAVWCSKEELAVGSRLLSAWQLVDAASKKIVFNGEAGKPFGAYGPFKQTYRLNFSAFTKPGKYYLKAGETVSPEFEISDSVYKGAADFCLRYMRQQRSGFNPFLKDSCHTHDGYVLYGQSANIEDSTHVDVVGGWHDATDYLQYSTTSANATYHLLMAYRDFPGVFSDEKQANGLDGSNGMADVLDEAKWGLDWLLKMHPRPDWMFNQVADDRDHAGMRLPKEDSFYGKGFERPVYFVSGEPQQRQKFMNNTTGTSSTAGKFSSAFALGAQVFSKSNKAYAESLVHKSSTAYWFGMKKSGASQTASVKSPYIYAEDNWTDDMELALAALNSYNNSPYAVNRKFMLSEGRASDPGILDQAYHWAKDEPTTPWLGKDSAKHYQWYPFINVGHYELAKQLKDKRRDTVISYYKKGIELVWNKAKQNAFYRGVPFIWCSNNLATSFAIQCYWYRQLTKDNSFSELEQANFDWLFGCNPWGTSFVYGLPSWGDTPVDPHSSLTHLNHYPIDGGLVDGPVYAITYKNQLGLALNEPDEYAEFQSDYVVYHDDVGDYCTNEPTMDGTASLIYLLAAKEAEQASSGKWPGNNFSYDHGAIIRGDSTQKKIALVFTGDEFGDGGNRIQKTLRTQHVKASFFLTGNFYRNAAFKPVIQQLKKDGHYLGSHSDKHLLYCDWDKRDSLLVSKKQFINDIQQSYAELKKLGVAASDASYFLPPYEWYNDSIASWTKGLGLQLINYTPGTKSNTDYTYPGLKNYQGSEVIYNSIINYEQVSPAGLNGFILLVHIGTDPARTDKFYDRLGELLIYLTHKGYNFQTVNELLKRR